MHFTVETGLRQYVSPVGLEGAAVVVDTHPRDTGDDPVGDFGRQQACHGMVVTLPAPPADHIKALVEFLDEHGDIRWVVLQIRIQGHDDLALGVLESCTQGCGLAEVFSEADDLDVGIVLMEALQRDKALVCATVIHENDLVSRLILHGLSDVFVQAGQVLLLIQ